jgi:tetratricopeptide (TPR) repeat protein
MTGTNAVLHLSQLSHSQAYLGAFPKAEAHAREACAVAQETGRPYDAGIAHFGNGIVKLCRGKIDEAIASLETGYQACAAQGITALLPMIGSRLGFAYAVDGQLDKGAELLEHALQNSGSAIHVYCWSLTYLGWCEYRRGAATSAFARQHQAVQLARQHGYRGIEVWALWLLGIMLHDSDRSVEARDVLLEAASLAKSLEMRLHAGYCHSVLSDVCGRLGESERSGEAATMASQLLGGEAALGALMLMP